jgi:uncharacterized protein YdiU (UPF0061 family)
VPLMPDADAAIERFTAMLHVMKDHLRAEWLAVFAEKIGIANARVEDAELIADLLDMMEKGGSDFTNTFSALTRGSAIDEITDRDAYQAWHEKWQDRLKDESASEALMASRNPLIIPRNHRIEQMITAAVEGNFAPFHRLNKALSTPFEHGDDTDDLKRPPHTHEIVPATFCGT